MRLNRRCLKCSAQVRARLDAARGKMFRPTVPDYSRMMKAKGVREDSVKLLAKNGQMDVTALIGRDNLPFSTAHNMRCPSGTEKGLDSRQCGTDVYLN